MTKTEYIANISKLNEYTRLYDEGTPAITDKEWDDLWFSCKDYEKETGYVDAKSPTSTIQFDVVNRLKKVTHNHPMLSLDKTKDINVLRKWIATNNTIVMHKLDGLTCSLKYENGKLISAETRGNGIIGEDVTENIMRMPSVPKTISSNETLIIDGEVICKYDDFEEFSDIYKNPRNFASGSIRLLDADESYKRKLTFVAWDLINSNEDFVKCLDYLDDLGFIVVDHEYTDLDNMEDQQLKLKKLASDHNFPIDGLVYRINDKKVWLSKGKTEHSFNGSYAFKLYDELYETELVSIDWSVAKTGRITPIAVFKPVIIDGTTVQRASMHNLTIMESLLGSKPYVGQKVWIIKANCIIPQVVKAEKND